MNFLVIGHLCYDEINIGGQDPVTGFGGIYYTVASLAAIAGNDHTIIPVFGVGIDREEELYSKISAYSNILTDGIFTLDHPTNTVKLFYDEAGERIECSEHIAPPIPVSAVEPFMKRSDAVLVNMVSGFDITFDVLYMINDEKRSRNVPVYLDFHSMTLGIDENNKRFRRPMVDWRRWAFQANIIQMSELEASTLTVERLSELQLAKLMMSLGPSAMIITRGERGVHVYYTEKKKVLDQETPGIALRNRSNNVPGLSDVDPTGCGDVYGAACLYHYGNSGDIVAATKYANRVAARKALLSGSDNLQQLSDETMNEAE